MFSCDISHLEYDVALAQLSGALVDPNHISCQIEFEADHSQSKIIRDFVGMVFDIHHIDSLWKGRFILITDELINNAIEHGSQKWDIDSCMIEAHIDWEYGLAISLEVHDTGRWKDAKGATHMETLRTARQVDEDTQHGIYMEKRGRGLFYIIEKLVDRLSFTSSPKWGLAVKIEKYIKPLEK